jgi:hypothetical protein
MMLMGKCIPGLETAKMAKPGANECSSGTAYPFVSVF